MPATDQVAAADTASTTAVYVFGITWARTARRGEHDGDVDAVDYEDLAAVVGPAPARPVRARRRDLLRHTEVLQQAFAAGTVLPLRFGTVFRTRAAVAEELLAERYGELVRLLRRFEGLAELRVRAAYIEEAILAEIVRSDARVAGLREAARTGGPGTQALNVELGESVARALDARRGRDGDELVHTLCGRARDAVIEERQSDLEVFRGSFLVHDQEVAEFDRLVDEIAQRERGRTTFKYTGPLPPYSFVSLTDAGSR